MANEITTPKQEQERQKAGEENRVVLYDGHITGTGAGPIVALDAGKHDVALELNASRVFSNDPDGPKLVVYVDHRRDAGSPFEHVYTFEPIAKPTDQAVKATVSVDAGDLQASWEVGGAGTTVYASLVGTVG